MLIYAPLLCISNHCEVGTMMKTETQTKKSIPERLEEISAKAQSNFRRETSDVGRLLFAVFSGDNINERLHSCNETRYLADMLNKNYVDVFDPRYNEENNRRGCYTTYPEDNHPDNKNEYRKIWRDSNFRFAKTKDEFDRCLVKDISDSVSQYESYIDKDKISVLIDVLKEIRNTHYESYRDPDEPLEYRRRYRAQELTSEQWEKKKAELWGPKTEESQGFAREGGVVVNEYFSSKSLRDQKKE